MAIDIFDAKAFGVLLIFFPTMGEFVAKRLPLGIRSGPSVHSWLQWH